MKSNFGQRPAAALVVAASLLLLSYPALAVPPGPAVGQATSQGQSSQAPQQAPQISQPAMRAADSPLASGENYILAPGDLVAVSFFGDVELNRDCLIRPDGTILLAYISNVKAAGKNPEQLQALIEETYKAQKFLKNPQVTVTIKEFHSSPVVITGAVIKATTIQVTGHTKLLQAINMADGFGPQAGAYVMVNHAPRVDAAGNSIPGDTKIIKIRELQEHPENPELNVDIRGGDTINVPRTDYIWVGGAVTKPGMLAMNDVPDWTVLKALVAVGNPTKTSKREHATVLRAQADGSKKEIELNLKRILQHQDPDFPLLANDILLVPESASRAALQKAVDSIFGLGTGLALITAGRP